MGQLPPAYALEGDQGTVPRNFCDVTSVPFRRPNSPAILQGDMLRIHRVAVAASAPLPAFGLLCQGELAWPPERAWLIPDSWGDFSRPRRLSAVIDVSASPLLVLTPPGRRMVVVTPS